MKYVTVVFYNDTSAGQWGTREYQYLAEDEQIVEGANYAVVMAPNDVAKAVKVTRVEDFDMSLYNGKFKFIICMVDTTAYHERIDRMKRMEAIRRELKKKAERAIEQRAWKDLLTTDEDAQELMKQLDILEGKQVFK